MRFLEQLKQVNLVFCAGSLDAILTTAAFLRVIRTESKVKVVIKKHHWLRQISPNQWFPDRKVAIIGLPNAPDVRALIYQLMAAGHELLAIIDERQQGAWHDFVADLPEPPLIHPEYSHHSWYSSCGEMLRGEFVRRNIAMDDHTLALLEAAEGSNRMERDTNPILSVVSRAVLANQNDQDRRVHAVYWYTDHREPSEQLKRWANEYRWIETLHSLIVAQRDDLGDGIVRVLVPCTSSHDFTGLKARLYALGAKVIVVRYLPVEETHPWMESWANEVSLATDRRDLDLQQLLQTSVTVLRGNRYKVAITIQDEALALDVLRPVLRGLSQPAPSIEAQRRLQQ